MKRKYSGQLQYIVYHGEYRLRLSLPLLLSSAPAAASVTRLVVLLVSAQDCGAAAYFCCSLQNWLSPGLVAEVLPMLGAAQ